MVIGSSLAPHVVHGPPAVSCPSAIVNLKAQLSCSRAIRGDSTQTIRPDPRATGPPTGSWPGITVPRMDAREVTATFAGARPDRNDRQVR
jgi:hypothetical protein